MKKIGIMSLLSLIAFTQIHSAYACVIAVESNIETTLLKEVYKLKDLRLTTDTKIADVGIKLAVEEIKKSDPIFGEMKMIKTHNLRADIYERGNIIASTGYHLATDFSLEKESPFARDLKRTLEKVDCR